MNCTSEIPAKTYSVLKEEFKEKKQQSKAHYDSITLLEQNKFTNKLSASLHKKVITELLPKWHGTQWDFNGTTRTPKQGKIACGYFVMNTLVDAGFDIPRIKFAQSASEPVIKKLCGTDIKRFSNRPMSEVEAFIKQKGEGLFMVGLDSHVGYITYLDGKIRFVHADYYDPTIGVRSQTLYETSPLKDSRYRIVGKLLNKEMMKEYYF